MTDYKRILICPLDWGLGHASRITCIIKHLRERGHEIFIAGSGSSLAFLKNEFPDNQFLPLPSPEIKYDRRIPAWRMILTMGPGLLLSTVREHRAVKSIIREYHINIIISDARYGLWHSDIPSVLVTHQLAFKLPVKSRLLERIIMSINRIAIKRFWKCWVPDYQGFPNLSGELSHANPIPANARFIGPVSRFENTGNIALQESEYEIVAIISGPEPQRSVFEELLIGHLESINRKSLIVCGLPGILESRKITDYCTTVSFLTGNKLAKILVSSRYIICRSGYSSIMDLVSLKRTAFLVPTPGQTEQEYLAEYLSANNLFPSCRQDDFHLEGAITALENYKSRLPGPFPDLLEKAITELESAANFSRST